ncbi:HAMP domain-containing histidine kinase [Methylobacillus arboreus]|uniref:sensor histidine kinase n=1 Tax=Methylobacillus arboreus TaxID=755170 RepID=UPI001E5F0971|nr:HAMP domain-containing sensor histidine kinase [Methylobacillus arboreus]MCB5190263.1 HAMP domain-containing histidine kinase [Methylobacillus arboreus]
MASLSSRTTAYRPSASTLQQWMLGLMLLSFHGVLLWGFDDPLQKSLLLCHYGLFLIWQPIWQTQEKLSPRSMLLFAAGGILLAWFVSWWLLAIWMSALFGLLGGRIFSTTARTSRLSYLLAATYLLSVLLLWVIPHLLDASAALIVAEFLMLYLLPILPLAILFLRVKQETHQHAPILDFFYTLLLFLLSVTLVLSIFTISRTSEADYAEVVIWVIFGLAATLLLASWLWNPRAGFSGIGQLLSRYLLSVGLPFERWIKNIAELAERETSAREFMQAAMGEVETLPWVAGGKWETEDDQGEFGTQAPYHAELEFHDFYLKLYSRWPLTPALTIHLKLLTQILGEFHEAKRREEALLQNTYMQAIYETGARLTHDMKNIVQSMSALCSAAEQASDADNERLVALIRKQLPLLNQRLALTLDKLGAPRNENRRMLPLLEWWDNLQQRYTDTRVSFSEAIAEDPELKVDSEVWDSVMDNLLQNALAKARHEPEINISAKLAAGNEVFAEVTDSGSAMPEEIAANLFRKRIRSEGGLGIGLYQAGRQAQQAGYQLALVENRPGMVRFRLGLK